MLKKIELPSGYALAWATKEESIIQTIQASTEKLMTQGHEWFDENILKPLYPEIYNLESQVQIVKTPEGGILIIYEGPESES